MFSRAAAAGHRRWASFSLSARSAWSDIAALRRPRSFYVGWAFVACALLAGGIGIGAGRDALPALPPQLSLISEKLASYLPSSPLFSADTSAWPGTLHRAKGARPHYPVVMVPGVVSTGLELWEGLPCARSYFRQRFWLDSVLMLQVSLPVRSIRCARLLSGR